MKHGIVNPPAVSTVGEVLKRHGLVKARRRRGGLFKIERGDLTVATRGNHVWGVDFKGWFTLEDGERRDPLTMSDPHSGYLVRYPGSPAGDATVDPACLSLGIQAIRASGDHPGRQRITICVDGTGGPKQAECVVDCLGNRSRVYPPWLPTGQRLP